jgi:hypothetical protein
MAKTAADEVAGSISVSQRWLLATLLLATLADHLDICYGHVAVLFGVFVHAVLLSFCLGVERGLIGLSLKSSLCKSEQPQLLVSGILFLERRWPAAIQSCFAPSTRR